MAITSGRFIATPGAHVMRQFFSRFIADESAVTAVEYALIAALISIAIVAGARAVGLQISGTFNTAKTTMKTA
jgi:pilus assembly protein Flp/PilA